MARTRLALPILLAALGAIGAPHGAAGRSKPASTTLLYSFVSNQGSFDTGIAIANTSADPFGTTQQNGTCALTFFGANAPAASTTPEILAGTVHVFLTSSAAPGFQGYLIAECNFSFAHGLSFTNDIGAQKLAMANLALVIPPRGRKSGERLDH